MPIVKEGRTKDERPYVIRYPQSDDVQGVWEYINKLSKERTYVRFQGEDIPIEQEERFIAEEMKKIAELKGVLLFLIVDQKVHGICGIRLHDKTESHVGTLGISIDESVRGQGLGEILMQEAVAEAARKLPGIRMIELKVKAPNRVALALYKKLGFMEYGKLPEGTQHRGKFVDEIFMYKLVGSNSAR